MAAGVRAELEDAKRNSEEKIERLDMKIQTVTKYYIFIMLMFIINVYSHINLTLFIYNIIKGLLNRKLGKVLLKAAAIFYLIYLLFNSRYGHYLSFQLTQILNSIYVLCVLFYFISVLNIFLHLFEFFN